ncbi:MAG: tetratricopeptide repeat protein [Caldithrix sp.]|nr:MAG: tetratricopeptide repeat protein [Caldithrix sp.]
MDMKFDKYFSYFMIMTLSILCLANTLLAKEVEVFFVRGNESYQAGNYKVAIKEFEKILNSDYESWEVYYNLGNAYFKDGQTAKAILNFERAKKLNLKDEDINYNLELANLAIVDRIQELPQFFLFKWASTIAHSINLKVLGGITLSTYLLLIFLTVLRIYLKSPQLQRTAFVAIISASVTLTVFTGLFVMRIFENETKIEAIVIKDRVDVKSAPGGLTEVFTLHEGVKVQIKDHSETWVKIRLADGKIGWLEADVLETI